MGKEARIRRAVIAAVAVTAGAAALHFSPRPGKDSTVRAATPEAGQATAHAKSGDLADLAVPSRDGLSGSRTDLFAGAQPVRPREKPQAPVVVEKPVAPPFPYKFGGRLVTGNGAPLLFLQKGTELVAIKKGEILDGVWRVESLTDDRIEVSFVPLGERLALTFASLTTETSAQGDRYADAPAAGRAFSNTRSEVAAAPTRAESRPVPASPSGGFGRSPVPSRASLAPVPPATPSASAGPGSSVQALPGGKLGLEAPTTGSMPTGPAPTGSSMPIGPAPSGTMPTSPAPTGKLGL
jgi:hypothetical protein